VTLTLTSGHSQVAAASDLQHKSTSQRQYKHNLKFCNCSRMSVLTLTYELVPDPNPVLELGCRDYDAVDESH